ncbi:MAG: hypothetical protein JXB13_16540, partial [Phycisphaerae bacterium]|nr:hypothetical protein [Phycisphaerae bacterium]
AGSLRVTAGSHIEAYNTVTVTGPGETLQLDSQGTLTLGSTGLVDGKLTNLGGVLQAPHQVLLSSTGLTEIKPAISVASTEQDSQVQITAGELRLAGALYGGAVPGSKITWTGRSADISITVTGACALSGKGYDQNGLSVDWAGTAEATGAIQLSAGSITSIGPGNTTTTALSLIRSNSAGDGTLTGTLGTSSITVSTSGDASLYGVVKAEDASTTVSITAGGLLTVDGIVRAQSTVALTGGTNAAGQGVLVTALVVEEDSYGNAVALVDGTKKAIDEDGNLIDPTNPSQYVDKAGNPIPPQDDPVYGGEPIRVSGGSIETGSNGTISVQATGNVVLQGQVGDVQDVNGAPTTNVSAVSITSTAGQVQIYDLVNSRNTIDITAVDIRVIDVALVKTRETGSEIYFRATGLIDVERSPTTLHRAKVDAEALIHFYGGQIHVGGEIMARDTSGRVLLNSGGRLEIEEGQVISYGTVELNAGVPADLTEAQSLAGGFPVTSLSQSLISIIGHTGVDQRKEPAPEIVQTETTEQQLAGYHLEQDGSVTVTETVYEDTTVHELVGYEDVVVGSTWNTMNMTLTQDGYWSDTDQKKREYFIQGVDYKNVDVFRSTTVTAEFEQLTDPQRTDVLNYLNYKPLYDVTITDPRTYTRINGQTSYQTWTAAANWDRNVTTVIYVNVNGLNDKYLRVPADGATAIRDTILNVVSQGNPGRLQDETVGNYSETAVVRYEQDRAAYAAQPLKAATIWDTGLDTSIQIPAHWTIDADPDGADYDRWAVSYVSSGQRKITLWDSGGGILYQAPAWTGDPALITNNDHGDNSGTVRKAYAPVSYFNTTNQLAKRSEEPFSWRVGNDPYGNYINTTFQYVDGSFTWLDAVQRAYQAPNASAPGGTKIATPKNATQNDGIYAAIPVNKYAWIGGVLVDKSSGPGDGKVTVDGDTNRGNLEWIWVDKISNVTQIGTSSYDRTFDVTGRDAFANGYGTPYSGRYTNFGSGQPDFKDSHEEYTEMYGSKQGDNKIPATWNDCPIGTNLGYVMQKTGYFGNGDIVQPGAHYTFNWASTTTTIQDVRYQVAYAWTSQATDITQQRPIYHEKTVPVPTTVTRQITTWKMVPDYQTVTVITTERVYEDEGQVPVQPSGTFTGDSISAGGAVTLTTGGDILVQGNINASSGSGSIAMTAGGSVTVQGVLPADATLAAVAELRAGGTLSITAAGAILVADSARLTAEAPGGDITLRAGVGFVSAGPVLGGDIGEGLDLDGNIIYAVNARGPGGLQVRDALFTDQASQPNVTITAGYEILNWQNPNYGSTTNDNNLEAVMQSIRWSKNPSTVNVDLRNLTVGAFYKLQLLFHENNYPQRGFDIFAAGNLILNDFSPSLISSAGQGAVVTYTFAAGDPILNVVLNGAATT